MAIVARLQRLQALRGSEPVAVFALVAANLVPLVGVLWFGWSVWSVLVLYWLENGIVGVVNLARMALAQGGDGSAASRAGMMLFFTFHYGLFWLGHGLFVFLLPALTMFAGDGAGFGPLEPNVIVLGAVCLALSHATSFVRNYIGGGEYRSATLGSLMARPYLRVVILHVTILFGIWVLVAAGSPIAFVALLIGLKTVADLWLHLREHRAAHPQAQSV